MITPVYEQLDETTAELATRHRRRCAPIPRRANARREPARPGRTRGRPGTAPRRSASARSPTAGAVSDIGFMVDTDKIDAVIDGGRADVVPPFTAESVGRCRRRRARARRDRARALPARPDRPRRPARTRPPRPPLVADEAAAARAAWTDGTDDDPHVRGDARRTRGTARTRDSQAVLDDLVNGMAMALTEATKELADAASTAPPGERETVGAHGGDRVRRHALERARASTTVPHAGRGRPGSWAPWWPTRRRCRRAVPFEPAAARPTRCERSRPISTALRLPRLDDAYPARPRARHDHPRRGREHPGCHPEPERLGWRQLAGSSSRRVNAIGVARGRVASRRSIYVVGRDDSPTRSSSSPDDVGGGHVRHPPSVHRPRRDSPPRATSWWSGRVVAVEPGPYLRWCRCRTVTRAPNAIRSQVRHRRGRATSIAQPRPVADRRRPAP